MNDGDDIPAAAPEPSTEDGGGGVKIVVAGRIGTDPEELRRWADAVVDRGEAIKDMEIADLRALIEAVQSHPNVKLAPAWKRGDPAPSEESLNHVTALRIDGGRVLKADCKDLHIRISLAAHCRFSGETWFHGATFAEDAWFNKATFAGDAMFGWATFVGEAWFNEVTFAGGAWFMNATFTREAGFGGTTFVREAWFNEATFVCGAGFGGVTFAKDAWFNKAIFAGGAWFGEATFAGDAGFVDATFSAHAWFGRAIFAGDAWFGSATFAGEVSGDLRTCTVRVAKAAIRRRTWPALEPVWSFPSRALAAATARVRHGGLGWHRVRALGKLAILTRVSLIALFAVPIIASAYVALRAIIRKYEVSGQHVPFWVEWLTQVVGHDPHLSLTLMLTFFAAVAVTLGLLVYQVAAPDTIKKHDEDEHVRDVEARYPEGSAQRDDGLRRALERLEDQAKRRSGRHASFVKHHGDLIWLPPRDKIEWFKDETLPDSQRLLQITQEMRDRIGVKEFLPVVDPRSRVGFVPGAERARICLEEGARAEYWLKAHEKIFGAWASFLLYAVGIGCLLVILLIQCVKVGQAAGYWGGTTDAEPLALQTTPTLAPPSPVSP